MFLPVGKYVDGDDFICFVARVIKRGVVGDSEVAPKPVYDSSHLSNLGLKRLFPKRIFLILRMIENHQW